MKWEDDLVQRLRRAANGGGRLPTRTVDDLMLEAADEIDLLRSVRAAQRQQIHRLHTKLQAERTQGGGLKHE